VISPIYRLSQRHFGKRRQMAPLCLSPSLHESSSKKALLIQSNGRVVGCETSQNTCYEPVYKTRKFMFQIHHTDNDMQERQREHFQQQETVISFKSEDKRCPHESHVDVLDGSFLMVEIWTEATRTVYATHLLFLSERVPSCRHCYQSSGKTG
jgi:hypothetical protein